MSAHICTCGDCAVDPFTDRCKWQEVAGELYRAWVDWKQGQATEGQVIDAMRHYELAAQGTSQSDSEGPYFWTAEYAAAKLRKQLPRQVHGNTDGPEAPVEAGTSKASGPSLSSAERERVREAAEIYVKRGPEAIIEENLADNDGIIPANRESRAYHGPEVDESREDGGHEATQETPRVARPRAGQGQPGQPELPDAEVGHEVGGTGRQAGKSRVQEPEPQARPPASSPDVERDAPCHVCGVPVGEVHSTYCSVSPGKHIGKKAWACGCGKREVYGDDLVDIHGTLHRLGKPCYLVEVERSTPSAEEDRRFVLARELIEEYDALLGALWADKHPAGMCDCLPKSLENPNGNRCQLHHWLDTYPVVVSQESDGPPNVHPLEDAP